MDPVPDDTLSAVGPWQEPMVVEGSCLSALDSLLCIGVNPMQAVVYPILVSIMSRTMYVSIHCPI